MCFRDKISVKNLKTGYSVGVSAYNEEKNLGQLLDFLLTENIPEILVYNDGSTDNTKKILEDYEEIPGLKIFNSSHNRGFSYGFNWILQNAIHNIVVNVDADTIPQRNAISHLVEPLAHPNVGASCGTHIMSRNGRNIVDRLNSRIYRAKYCLDKYNNKQGIFTHLNGLLLAFKKNCIAGETFDNTNIDVYLGYTIYKKGYTVLFVEHAKSFFYPPSTVRDYIHSRNRVIMGHYVLAYDYKIHDYLYHEAPFPTYFKEILRAQPVTILNLLSLTFGAIVDIYFRLYWFHKVKTKPKTFNTVKWKYLASTKEAVVYA